MKSGLQKIRPDHRDYSHHKSFGLAAPPSFPDYFNVDPGLTNPNQELANDTYTPPAPALPYGCTDYAQTELCIYEDTALYSPMLLENVTHANAQGGLDIRVALKAACTTLNRTAYFSIQASGPLDWFDAIRVSMFSTSNEKRGVSVGTPWFPEFERPVNGILPIPIFDTSRASWHNWAIVGWKTILGVPYLIGKSWQGTEYADNGYCYVSRELTNALLKMWGTGAFTLSKVVPPSIQTVDLGIVATIVSFIRNLLHL